LLYQVYCNQTKEPCLNMSIESFAPTAASLSGGFLVGILIGYALKKVIKILAVIVGLFLAGLTYLQYHQVANINWNKLQQYLRCYHNTFKCNYTNSK
jgi:uncharacterized membrane protein (Fun14 family)